MDNVKVDIKADTATITVDLKAKGRKSASGKTTVIGSSRGNQEIAPGVFMGLNVYTK